MSTAFPVSADVNVRLHVRPYEVNRLGFVHDHIYQQYLEVAAVQASSAAGFTHEWYNERGTVWVVREITVDYLHPAQAGDELNIRTWISDFRRVRSHREYEITRVHDGLLLVRASADWVYIDRKTLWPIRIPAEAMTAFASLDGRYAVPPARAVPPLPDERSGCEFTVERTVQRHEVDGMGHVNNANYVTWFEQAALDALASWLPTSTAPGWPCWRRHQIEYVSAILPGEGVNIVTRLVGLGRARSAWYQEVRRPGSEHAAIRDASIVLWLDELGRLRPWPSHLAG